MKLEVVGNRLYVDQMLFCHCGVNHGDGDTYFYGTVEPRYSHSHGRELPIADGLGWLGGDASCAIVVGRVINGDGKVLPCKLTETRLMTLVNMSDELGMNISLEVKHG